MRHVSTTVGFHIAVCALRAEWNNEEDMYDAANQLLRFYVFLETLCFYAIVFSTFMCYITYTTMNMTIRSGT